MVVSYHIKASLKLIYVPSLGNASFVLLVLVVSKIEYNKHVPSIIGTNVIH